MSADESRLRISALIDGSSFDLRVIPGASKSGIAGIYDGALKLRVSEPPERGKANKAVMKLLAKVLDLSERGITILSGETSQNKTVKISGLTPTEIIERFNKSGFDV